VKLQNIKCDGCRSRIRAVLEPEFGELELNGNELTLKDENVNIESLKARLKELGYPQEGEEMSTFDSIKTKSMSFVSCSIGRVKS
jgi:copper chaperone CopZ